MSKLKYDNQLRRQCFDLPVMCNEQTAGVCRGLEEGVPRAVLKNIRRLIITGCGDSYMAAMASIPVFKRYAGAFASDFAAVKCMEAARYIEYGDGKGDTTLVICVSASGGPARVVEVLCCAKAHGCHTLLVTNNPDSQCAGKADYVLNVHTPDFSEPGPGLRNYYGSMVGLFGLAAAMGEAKGISPQGTLEKLMKQIETLTADYGKKLDVLDDQMYTMAGSWKDQQGIETVGDSTSCATACFVSAKYVEAVGMMAVAVDTENWCHVNYFKYQPGKIGVILTANEGEPNQSRVLETISQAEGIGRPVLLVTDEDKKTYGVKGQVSVCTVPKAPKDFEFLAPLLNYIPGTLLAAYVAAYREEPYFRGPDSRQRRSAVGCTVKDSVVCMVSMTATDRR